MVWLLTLIGVIGALALWENDHRFLAVVFGILFIGGAGWGILFNLISALIPGRRRSRGVGADPMEPLLHAMHHPERPIVDTWMDVRARAVTAGHSDDWTHGTLRCEPNGTIEYFVATDDETDDWTTGSLRRWSTSSQQIDGVRLRGLRLWIDEWEMFVENSNPYSPERAWVSYFHLADRVSEPRAQA